MIGMHSHSLPSLSIRSYTKTMHSHAHSFYQLVLPINGHIEIIQDNFEGKVGVGQGVCIAPEEVHTFKSHSLSKFVVADLKTVPEHFKDKSQPIFQVDATFQAFLNYIDVQLSHTTKNVHSETVALFLALLNGCQKGNSVNKRITPAISHIHQDLTQSHSVGSLSSIACMGATQFKVKFKEATGLSLRDYLVKTRMEKAKALLSNTDTPIFAVALSVGYDDVTSFTRRFKAYFGQPPGYYKRS